MVEQGNPGRLEYINRITKQLGFLATSAKIGSASNRNDLAGVSEHTISGLLNRIYGWNLIRMDTYDHVNFHSVDLADEKAGVTVQVTVENSLRKVDEMLNTFKKNKLNRRFNRLILLIITVDKPTKTMLEREDGCFYGKRDIWNLQRLMKEIEGKTEVAQLREIAEYLDTELGFVTMNNLEASVKKENKPIKQTPSAIVIPKLEIIEKKGAQEKKTQRENKRKEKKTDSKIRRWYFWVLTVMSVILLLSLLLQDHSSEKMPAELAGYALIINEEVVNLPVSFSQMEELGWEFKNNTEKSVRIEPGDFGESTFFQTGYSTELTNGYGTIEVWYGNPSQHSLRTEECIIYKIVVSSWSTETDLLGKPVNTFRVSDSFVLRQSQWDDRKRPDGYKKLNRSTITNYCYILDDNHWYNFMFDKNSKILTDIVICNKDEDAMEKLVGDLYDTKQPQYNPEALAEWIGTDMGFQIGNFYIPVGCITDEYSEMGCQIDEVPSFLASGDLDDFYFSYGDIRVIGKVYNPFPRALLSDYCYLGCIDSSNIQSSQEHFVFCCSIGENTISIPRGMTESELIQLLEIMELAWLESSTDSVTFFPNQYNKNVFVECTFTDDARIVGHIRIDICEALREYFFSS